MFCCNTASVAPDVVVVVQPAQLGPDEATLTLRTIILNCVLDEKSLEDIEKYIMEKTGKEYDELDYWYHYFANGGRDVKYDRAEDHIIRIDV